MDQAPRSTGLGIHPLLSLKRHYRVSIWVFFLIALLGQPIVWIKGRSIYSAEAVFQVAPRYMKNLESDAEVELQSNSQYREFVNHLQNTVSRYDVLERALEILQAKGIDPRPPALTKREYIEQLQRTLIRRAIADTYMVRVGLDGSTNERAYLHMIVNAIMASFLETSKAEQIYGSAERLNVLRDESRQLRDEIADMDLRRAKLAERLGLTTFAAGTVNPYDQLLAGLREKLTAAEIERRRAEATYKAFVRHRELPSGQGRSLLEMRLGDMSLLNMRNETEKRITELNQKLAGLTQAHPARAPTETEIDSLRQRLRKAETAYDKQNFSHFRARMAASVQELRAVEDGIRSNVTDMEGQASEFAQVFQNAMQLTQGIVERNDRIQQIRKRLNYLETESNALGFVRLVTPALPAEMPKGVGKTKLMLGLLLAAMGAALGFPVLLDMLDRRIRNVGEAEKVMGIPAAGWQIRREDLPTQLYADEQSRKFAATLIRLRARNQRNRFAFTALKTLGGATTTVLDTARTLAGLGVKVLVVEANSFTPSSKFDNFAQGLSDMLVEGLDPMSLIRPYPHEGTTIDVIGVGSCAHGGLQRLDRLRQAIDQWGQSYEFILFDLPPVMLSADAEMLIEMLGQVFLVVQAEAVEKGELVRARQLLHKLDPEAVGLYVNGIAVNRDSAAGTDYIEQSIVETLTRTPFKRFNAGANRGLQLQLLFTRWVLGRSSWLRKPFAWLSPRNRKASADQGTA